MRSFEVSRVADTDVYELVLFEDEEEVGAGVGTWEEMWDAGAEWNGWIEP